MAFPTSVNNQITDAVTQIVAPDDQTLANAAHNATNSQPQSYVTDADQDQATEDDA
jgi:hypothetical protein